MSLLIGQIKVQLGNIEERQEMTCSKEPLGGIKPGTTAASTQPLYIADPHYPPSHHRAPSICKTLTPESCWVQFRSVRDCCAHCHKIMCLWDCYEIRTTGFVHTAQILHLEEKNRYFVLMNINPTDNISWLMVVIHSLASPSFQLPLKISLVTRPFFWTAETDFWPDQLAKRGSGWAWWRRIQTLVRSRSIMMEAYGSGLPGCQKPLVSENHGILNTRNAPTRRIATSGTQNVLLVCDYHM